MASRKIEDLTPEMQELYFDFEAKMSEANIPFLVTCTYRSQEEHDGLWAKGRTAPGNKVTWTRHSKHTERKAFDIVILKENRPAWDIKVDVNEDDIPDYLEAAQIARDVGLICGADFRPNPDYPHFQFKEEA